MGKLSFFLIKRHFIGFSFSWFQSRRPQMLLRTEKIVGLQWSRGQQDRKHSAIKCGLRPCSDNQVIGYWAAEWEEDKVEITRSQRSEDRGCSKMSWLSEHYQKYNWIRPLGYHFLGCTATTNFWEKKTEAEAAFGDLQGGHSARQRPRG